LQAAGAFANESRCMYDKAALIRECYDARMKVQVEHHTLSGGAWLAAWLFSIDFLHLSFWQGVLAIVIWPYYLGAYFAH
jgi:hypothetical protein